MSQVFQRCGASVIVYKGDQVLLQQRKDNRCWAYHGGCVELGENVEQAARRELFEETGLVAEELDFFGIYSGPEQHHIYPDGNEVYFIDIIYTCTAFTGELCAQLAELLDLRWFAYDAIPNEISPPIKSALLDFIQQHYG